MAALTEEEIISIERACERLVLDFAHYSDRQDHESLAALFVEQGIMARPTGDPLVGRGAIFKSYQSRSAGRITRHVCTNIRITVESNETAHGLTYAIVYSANANDPPVSHFGVKADARQLIGEFEDEFTRSAEGWRFAARRARFVMHTA